MTDFNKLVRCPFCGDERTMYYAQDIKSGYDEAYWVACPECPIGQDPHDGLTKGDAQSLWNSRFIEKPKTIDWIDPKNLLPENNQIIFLLYEGKEYTGMFKVMDHPQFKGPYFFFADYIVQNVEGWRPWG